MRRRGELVALCGMKRILQFRQIVQPVFRFDPLWRPFLSPSHHLIIAFVNPLFVRLQRKGMLDFVYRVSGNNTWERDRRLCQSLALGRELIEESLTLSMLDIERVKRELSAKKVD